MGSKTLTWSRGFSLVELIMVLVLVGVLLATVVPRLGADAAMKGEILREQVLVALRHAQKVAIAQRRMVRATFSQVNGVDALTLTVATACDLGCNAGENQFRLAGDQACLASPDFVALRRPDADTNQVSQSGAGFNPLPAWNGGVFIFDCKGRWNYGGTRASAAERAIVISGMNNPVCIENETGYVHVSTATTCP